MMAFVPIAVGHARGKAEKPIIALLRERGAWKRETAQPLPDLSKSQRHDLERKVDGGIVRLVAGHRYYLDDDALRDHRSRQLAIGFAFIVVAAGIGAAWLLIG
jgi:hypothetical protein